ncbi:MAG: SDR family NAD(P)-dependent oxidoreductase, partial [Turicibacter sp.]|nr:SDR family NAD(P)-dependent oxidoreductase [Turicibacter sp.]
MNKLKDKVALVTSGTRGIGLQCVKTLAQNGATVYIGARRLEVANEICKDLLTQGFIAKSVYFDATKTETYESMIDNVIKDAGRLDILVNNYGGTDAKTDLDLVHGETSTFFNTMNLNISSVYLPCKFAIRQMLKQESGSIINISSIGSILPDVARLGYGVSKAAVNSLTQN